MIQALLAKYAMQILSGLLAVAVVAGGYYYWKHSVASEAIAENNKLWKERDQKDIQHAAEIMAAENAKIEIIKQHYEDHNNAELNKFKDYVKTLTADNAAANAAVIRMRNYQASRAASCENRVPTTTDDSSGTGRASDEDLQTAMSIKAVEIIIEDYVKKYFVVK